MRDRFMRMIRTKLMGLGRRSNVGKWHEVGIE